MDSFTGGYSAQVRGWLSVNGVRLELAQVGPDFCILRETMSEELIAASEIRADLVIDVDGSQRKLEVLLSSNNPANRKKLPFRRI